MRRLTRALALILLLSTLLLAASAADSFTRADSADIGTDWLAVTPGFRECQIISNAVFPSTLNVGCFEVWTSNLFSANQTAMASIGTWTASGDSQVGVIVRSSTSGTGRDLDICVARRGGSNTSFIREYVADAGTDLVTENAITWASTDTIRCTASGSTITMYRNGVQILQATTIITSGSPGVSAFNDLDPTNVSIDTWSATSGNIDVLNSAVIQ